MHSPQKVILFFITSVLSLAFSPGPKPPKKDIYTAKGRIEKADNSSIILIGSASSVTFGFKGTTCTLNLQASDTRPHHNYVVIEVDGQYYSRKKIMPAGTKVEVIVPTGSHTLSVYKATEAANGNVVFKDAEGDIFRAIEKPKKKIEFIGDSITCGMGNDLTEIPCGTGEWYDQHNAYYSYAPITARALGADYLLSSVSGIGMYRNWNDEHDKEAIMPDVYEHLYLNKDNPVPYPFGYNAAITCIALGTNDFSDGDGKKQRLPFNEDKYVANYVKFITMIYSHSPNTRIVMLTSPMVTGEKSGRFIKCLNRVKQEVDVLKGHKPAQVFTFTAVTPHGCGSHPEIEDDKLMAAQLAPFLKTLLNDKK